MVKTNNYHGFDRFERLVNFRFSSDMHVLLDNFVRKKTQKISHLFQENKFSHLFSLKKIELQTPKSKYNIIVISTLYPIVNFYLFS